MVTFQLMFQYCLLLLFACVTKMLSEVNFTPFRETNSYSNKNMHHIYVKYATVKLTAV